MKLPCGGFQPPIWGYKPQPRADGHLKLSSAWQGTGGGGKKHDVRRFWQFCTPSLAGPPGKGPHRMAYMDRFASHPGFRPAPASRPGRRPTNLPNQYAGQATFTGRPIADRIEGKDQGGPCVARRGSQGCRRRPFAKVFGRQHLPVGPRTGQTTVKNARIETDRLLPARARPTGKKIGVETPRHLPVPIGRSCLTASLGARQPPTDGLS